jgi:hypothetical protein
MPTFELRCSACGEMRWPMLAERPLSYVCVRCTAVGASKRAARRESAAKGRKSRQTPRMDAGGASHR